MARSLAIPALLAATLLAATVWVGTARADDDCAAPMSDWQPRAAVADLAAAQGWQVRRIRVDDGCYQILGQDAAGRSIEVTLDPATLAVIEIELDDDDGDDGDGGGHGDGDQPTGTKPSGGAPRPGGGNTRD